MNSTVQKSNKDVEITYSKDFTLGGILTCFQKKQGSTVVANKVS